MASAPITGLVAALDTLDGMPPLDGGADGDAVAALRARLGTLPPGRAALVRTVLARSASMGPPAVHGGLSALLAADRWGLEMGGAPLARPEDGLAAARAGQRVLMDVAGVSPWWGRLLALPQVRVVAALPDDAARLPRALMIAPQTPEPTGDDRSFWVTDSSLPDVRLVEILGLSGLAASPLSSAGGLKLILLAGYVQAHDARLDALPGTLKGVIGSAPVF